MKAAELKLSPPSWHPRSYGLACVKNKPNCRWVDRHRRVDLMLQQSIRQLFFGNLVEILVSTWLCSNFSVLIPAVLARVTRKCQLDHQLAPGATIDNFFPTPTGSTGKPAPILPSVDQVRVMPN